MEHSQSLRFLAGEGDAYFNRNPLADEFSAGWVENVLAQHVPHAGSILEVGCGEGRRLAALSSIRDDIGLLIGIDPSGQAVRHGVELWPHLDLRVGVAEDLSAIDYKVDLVFFGFCLYLCDRNSLFRIADSAHNILHPGGAIAILDFDPPTPAKRRYAHLDGLWSYKMDYSKLWTGNPEYVEVERHHNWAGTTLGQKSGFDRLSLTVIRRSSDPYLTYQRD